MSSVRPRALLPALILALLAFLPSTALAAPSSTSRPDLWQPDGPVQAMVSDGSRLYIGGFFHVVGPFTGDGVPVSTSTGSPDAGFPVVHGGWVQASVADGAGGWYIGGSFEAVGEVAQEYLAHVLADGTVDTSFHPQLDGEVRALALHGSDLYVGGDFSNVGTTARSHLAKLDADTGAVDPNWDPSPSGSLGWVRALAVSDAGLYVGGLYTHIGGQNRTDLALVSLSGTGAADATFVSNVTSNADGVKALALANGKLYVGGAFSAIHGTTRKNVAAVSPTDGSDQGLDADFDGAVTALAATASKLYAGGAFAKVTHGGADTAVSRLAAVDAGTGAVDNGFTPTLDQFPVTLVATASSIYAGGHFTKVNGVDRNKVVKLSRLDGSVDSTWDPEPGGDVETLALQGGSIFVGGNFHVLGGVARHNVAAIELSTGRPVTGWHPDANDQVNALALAGGKLYMGGDFQTVDGAARMRAAAVSAATGTLDTNFQPGFDSGVEALEVAGGRVYAGGYFDHVNGDAALNLAAVDAGDGSTVWTGDVEGNDVQALAATGSTLYVGGDFSNVDGTDRANIAAVDATTGSLVSGWNPGADGGVKALTLDGSRLYVGGWFQNLGGASRVGLAAVDPASGALEAWTASADGVIESIVPSLSGVYVGGQMTQLGSQAVQGLGVVDPASAAVAPWAPQFGDSGEAQAVVISGGRLFAGGYFENSHYDEIPFEEFDFATPASTSAPAVTASSSGALTCSDGNWSGDPAKLERQWLRDGSEIAGATDQTYNPGATGIGHSFACRVTATNEAGSASATSAAFKIEAPQAPPAAGGGGSTAGDSSAPHPTIARASLKGRVLKLTLRCPHDEARCSGSVTLTAKGQRVGSAKFRVAGGKTTVVSVKLSRKVLSLAKGGRLRLSVAVTAADASGNTGATTRKLALKVGQRR